VTDAKERLEAPEAELVALGEGRAFADRSAYRKLRVDGPDARTWLNDLFTAGLAGLSDDDARRSLLLGPTGRIRADVVVVAVAEGLVLLQDPLQPTALGNLLAPYVLSSAVTLSDVTHDLVLYSIPGTAADSVPWPGSRPSVLGEGRDLLAPASDASRLEAMLVDAGLVGVGDDALEVRRIRRGIPRFPMDLTEESVPAEAALDDLIDVTKGCFLGQESVAKIRNLGHPAKLVAAARTGAEVGPGAEVLVDRAPVGRVTSAAPAAAGGTACLVRMSWAARDARLTTADGTRLTRGGDPT
jgi:tRNA-modifying protein YgfZ